MDDPVPESFAFRVDSRKDVPILARYPYLLHVVLAAPSVIGVATVPACRSTGSEALVSTGMTDAPRQQGMRDQVRGPGLQLEGCEQVFMLYS